MKVGRRHQVSYDDATTICDLLNRGYTVGVVGGVTRLVFTKLPDDIRVEHYRSGSEAPLGVCDGWVNDLLTYLHNHDPILFPPKETLT